MKGLRCTVLIGVIALLTFINASADDSVLGGSGMTVYPISSADIRMVSEKIDIKVDGTRSFVSCEFVFENQGKAAQILMGFPEEVSRSDFDDNVEINAFKAWINGKAIAVTKKKGGKPVENEYGNLVYPYWHTFNVSFKKGETLTVKNTYWVTNTYDSTGGSTVRYVLKTGAVWKDRIGKIDITMSIVGFMPYYSLNLQAGDDSYPPVSVTPYGTIRWHMVNVEPKKDIQIYFKETFDKAYYNSAIEAPKFWSRYRAMDYKNALKYVPDVVKVLNASKEESWLKDGVYIAIGATYYYNKDYKNALIYFGKVSVESPASLYYEALTYMKMKDYLRMGDCLGKLRDGMINNTGPMDPLKIWVDSKYKDYGRYF